MRFGGLYYYFTPIPYPAFQARLALCCAGFPSTHTPCSPSPSLPPEIPQPQRREGCKRVR
ncbi:predicted protein [Plenodomus lingam JN3]|uniref:Predicted protein n=1 Tax=Leptosphaeria maculans (strain JN3 / isolate v23.1.3 / race Av1-4-5-6-7-8) TaxID=985895 RepID=E4ZYX6_LEPMJ|nr:predicted protein [Plenodomus lingam JN3]CBX96411.1 predicted protein [Plenodomus lingam JN3]